VQAPHPKKKDKTISFYMFSVRQHQMRDEGLMIGPSLAKIRNSSDSVMEKAAFGSSYYKGLCNAYKAKFFGREVADLQCLSI
jgi:hypothetical protein